VLILGRLKDYHQFKHGSPSPRNGGLGRRDDLYSLPLAIDFLSTQTIETILLPY
jgi:hypothetical protein